MRRNIPSLQALLCFESAAKHCSYTHASQELFITQSAVSRQIQQLEEFLGLSLFIRTRHGVELTPAGQHYYKSIKPYLLGLEQSTLDVMSYKGLGCTLKLGVVPTFATRWLVPKLHRFNQRYPEITIHLETSTKPFLLMKIFLMRPFMLARSSRLIMPIRMMDSVMNCFRCWLWPPVIAWAWRSSRKC